MVTLSDLPQELKKLIVEWATEMDKASYSQPPEKEERIGEEIFANGNAPKDGCVRAISQLDSTFFSLCRPILWKVLDLRKLPTSALSGFHEGGEGGERLSRKYLRTLVQHVKTEVIIFHEPLQEEDELRRTVGEPPQARRRGELARFLELETVLCEDMEDPGRIGVLELELVLRGKWFDGYTPTCTHPLARRLFAQLARFANVRLFNLVCPVSLSVPENLLVDCLQNMALLTSLAADNISYAEARAHAREADDQEHPAKPRPPLRRLAACLAELKSLRSLRMFDSVCVDDVWSEMRWQTPLAEMELVRCGNLSSLGVQRLAEKFGGTLGRLRVWTVGQSEREQIESHQMSSGSSTSLYRWEILQRDRRPCFPNLRSLALVGTHIPEQLLRSFQHSPRLASLRIDSPAIRANALFTFIRNSKRLRSLNSRVRGGPGSIDVIMYCLSHAILLDESFY